MNLIKIQTLLYNKWIRYVNKLSMILINMKKFYKKDKMNFKKLIKNFNNLINS